MSKKRSPWNQKDSGQEEEEAKQAIYAMRETAKEKAKEKAKKIENKPFRSVRDMQFKDN